jgi:hypothetical protein
MTYLIELQSTFKTPFAGIGYASSDEEDLVSLEIGESRGSQKNPNLA